MTDLETDSVDIDASRGGNTMELTGKEAELEERIRILERRTKSWSWRALGMCGAFFVAALLMQFVMMRQIVYGRQILTGQTLQIRDSEGTVRCEIKSLLGPVVYLRDRHDNPRAELSLSDGEYVARLLLYNEHGRPGAELSVVGDAPHLRLFDASGTVVYSAP